MLSMQTTANVTNTISRVLLRSLTYRIFAIVAAVLRQTYGKLAPTDSLHMAQQQISAGPINAAVAALRFFFNVTLERPELVRHLTMVNTPRRAPVVLSQKEVARLL